MPGSFWFGGSATKGSVGSTSTPNSSPWIRKPLSVVHRQEAEETSLLQRKDTPSNHPNDDPTAAAGAAQVPLRRHLTVVDLVAIGLGGTIGSGIFVLTGQVAAQQAGGSTWISFFLAGLAACTSGLAFAELSARIPATGSTYVYAYVCLGESMAVLAAACLTLEYGIAGAAVARTWGDKVIVYVQHATPDDDESWLLKLLHPMDGLFNVPALLVSVLSTALLLVGVSESKAVANITTALKMLVVAFMTIGGLFLFKPSNVLLPWKRPPFGWNGVLRGSTQSFFGYLGYDEMCCLAGEAVNPVRDMPRAILWTLAILTTTYILASISLTGMIPYTEIEGDGTSAFPSAFSYNNKEWMAELTAWGEMITMPVVVLVSYLAQPRVTLGMANDGLLPPIFAQVDDYGNLVGGTAIQGAIMCIIAAVVPFDYLNDLISGGILVSFCMTNACLVLLRCESPPQQPALLDRCLLLFNALCFLTSVLVTSTWSNMLPMQWYWATLSLGATLACYAYMHVRCKYSEHFGGSILSSHFHNNPSNPHSHDAHYEDSTSYFRTPGVPLIPCIGSAINWYLIAQLSANGIVMLILYLGLTWLSYISVCAPNSEGHKNFWNQHAGVHDSNHNNNSNTGFDTAQREDAQLEGTNWTQKRDHPQGQYYQAKDGNYVQGSTKASTTNVAGKFSATPATRTTKVLS